MQWLFFLYWFIARYISWIKLRILYIFREFLGVITELLSTERMSYLYVDTFREHDLFSQEFLYLYFTCVCVWGGRGGPAKYGGYRSNHLRTRVSPGTCVALRIRVHASWVSSVYVCVCVCRDTIRQGRARGQILCSMLWRRFYDL